MSSIINYIQQTMPFRSRISNFSLVSVSLAGILLLFALSLGAPKQALAEDPAVTGVRLGINEGKTRVVLDLTKPVPYSAFLLSDPYRLVIDLPEVGWSVNGGSTAGNKGVVTRLRYGHFRAGNSRVVLDLDRPVIIATHGPLTGPHRIMFDLAPVRKSNFKPSVKVTSRGGWVPPTPAAMKVPVPAPKPDEVDGRRVIVIDAGHGGVDPGAVRRKIYEKRITLAMAATLKSYLESSKRYKVVLTRSRDTFLELRERIQVAHVNDADLFISLHADTHPKSSTRGASVYTLSEKASDKEAAALAASENSSDSVAGAGPVVDDLTGDILRDLQRRQTDRHSAIFAEFLTDQFDKRGVKLARYKAHRFAGFVVLKSPSTPSVLVEMGYLSNKHDKALLLKKDYRAKLAKAILASIDQYFKHIDDLARK